ncbi:MAG: bifunctional 5,10-methylenetetrahydrofolate dehydrogenase/5,10-methenyltetrahydrofolate cyclohydrolase [Anaerolineae bacterium]|jgi:methylenetetrahydrofolate dehydrogenase (NADP+)/methenyltetrahydrofolate cyclohydrolase|nr:bifunctional 5,10-methylenetetrahydrofolate dehydrogenase/5,10-methenyltetrahydrofolate cyclohydrolase [Chloroflexota bacterium]
MTECAKETGAILLDGRALATTQFEVLAQQVRARLERGTPCPGLAILEIGEDPAARAYVRAIVRSGERIGLTTRRVRLDAQVAPAALADALDAMAADSSIAGIIVQYPVPAPLMSTVMAHLPPHKDVDGILPLNAGLLLQGDPLALVPATPLGGMALLRHYSIALEGRHAVVVGRSTVVGKPMAQLLLQANATVTVCHTRTRNLPELTRQADILAVAAGRAHLITAEMIKPGAVVIDFGVNFVDGKMEGDVDTAAVAAIAGAITPVPGGTGPMTNVMLMRNVLAAGERLAQS